MATFIDEGNDIHLINKQAVLQAISELRMPPSFRERLNKKIEEIHATTIFGYEIHNLIVFADACRHEGITKQQLYDFCNNAKYAYEMVFKENDRMMREIFENMTKLVKGEQNE